MDLTSSPDVVVIGAGAAGLAAAFRLARSSAPYLLLEARPRVGGRAHTRTIHGLPLDLGCGWLHSAGRNSWVREAEKLGLEIDRSSPAWTRPPLNISSEDQKSYRRAFADFEAALERAAASGIEAAASTLFDRIDARWRPLLDAFSGYYNGAPFEEISIQDYEAYDPTNDNWRVRVGYGALMEAFAAPLSIVLECPVSVIDRTGERLRLITSRGVVEAKAVIVCVPTTVLADERLRIVPASWEKIEAAAVLPLGNVDKAFLRLTDSRGFEPDTRVQARTDTTDTAGYTLRPMGLPMVEAYFGGHLAATLESAGEGAFSAFAREELSSALGSDVARRLEPLAESRWSADPFTGGAYSHAKPGFADRRAVLAAPLEERIFFAGEACSAHQFSTAHGAFDTGVAAAEAALAALTTAPGVR